VQEGERAPLLVDPEALPEEIVHDHPVRLPAAVVAEQVVALQAAIETHPKRAGHAPHHQVVRHPPSAKTTRELNKQ